MIQHYTHLLQRYFPVNPYSVTFDSGASSYDVDHIVERYNTAGGYVELFNAQDEERFLDMRVNRAPLCVRKLLGMKAWGSHVDVGGFLRLAVDDSQKPTSWVRLGAFPCPDVRYRGKHMAGQTITDVTFQHTTDEVQLAVYSGSQLLVCARRPREEHEVSVFFDDNEKGND